MNLDYQIFKLELDSITLRYRNKKTNRLRIFIFKYCLTLIHF